MASLIPGYEYDIFISYRQKDNKGDRWVSEFVEALKSELESTFKEEVSIYFDINPHDGLLETHEVSDSLREKLKCLVFIPIISRTYCDPKSFAWEHEFIAFIEQASNDQFGLKVKTTNGNIASRILPVRIHDLDAEDTRLSESALGSVLRGVEFIYKSAGVNRPLRAIEEKPLENLNKTIYRDQINKVANAIKEIITGLNAGTNQSGKGENESRVPWEKAGKERRLTINDRPKGFSTRRLLSYIISAVFVLVLLGIYAYPKIIKRDSLEKLKSSGERVSVAVMPFQNLTNDTLKWNVYKEIIQNSITSYLSNFPEYLQVRQTESISDLLSNSPAKHSSFSPSLAQEISKTLKADIFILGDIIQSGNAIRLSARIIETASGEIIKPLTKEIHSLEESILPIIDTLSGEVRDFLIISKLNKEINPELQPLAYSNSIEAYNYFILGNNAYHKMDFRTSIELLSKAVEKDSNFILAITRLASSYFNHGPRELGEKWLLKAYNKREQVPEFERLWVNLNYARYFQTPFDEIKILKRIMETDDQMPYYYFRMGDIYMRLLDYEKAIPEFEKSLDIYQRWKVKPLWSPNYWSLIIAYRKEKQYQKEEKLYKKAEKDFPDNIVIIREHANALIAKGDTVAANIYINKFLALVKEDSGREPEPVGYLAYFYAQGNMPDKAEKYYRKALSLEPGNTYNFANFLINTDRNVVEGLELIEESLARSPDNYAYLQTKGWGLYKQGKYRESLKILQESWDLRMKKQRYNHEAFLHLEAAKKAVNEQK